MPHVDHKELGSCDNKGAYEQYKDFKIDGGWTESVRNPKNQSSSITKHTEKQLPLAVRNSNVD